MFLYVLVILGLISAGAILGYKLAPKPKPVVVLPPTPPKTFGLVQLEKVKAALGVLSSADAKVVKVAVAVGELEFTALDEIADNQIDLADSTASRRHDIEEYKAMINSANVVIQANTARDAELIELAGAFKV